MTKLAKAIRFFEKSGMSLLAINKRLHIDRVALKRELKMHYGQKTFELMWRENWCKWYNRAKLKAIDADIEAGELCLRGIARKHHTHHTCLYRNLERYYGVERWTGIFKYYKSKVGLQKGHLFGKATQYKKGMLRGIAARNWKPIGAIQYKKYRYGRRRKKFHLVRFIKVSDIPNSYNWMVYARWLWIQRYGHIPKGKFIVHLDDNRANDEFDNLALMTRGEHARYQDARFPKKLELRKQRIIRATKERIRIPIQYSNYWECSKCAGEFKRKPKRCPKCGSYSIKQVRLRCA